MVRHQMPLLNPAFPLFSQFPQYLTKMLSQRAVKNLPAVFRDEYNMNFALPSAVVWSRAEADKGGR
jgi:hypothetical protein